MVRCGEILNSTNTVHVLVSALQIPDALSNLCIIGHNLLLSDRLALHKCRYVYYKRKLGIILHKPVFFSCFVQATVYAGV